jgi:hypothetical protein
MLVISCPLSCLLSSAPHPSLSVVDESFADTLNTAWRNATEFSFDRSKLQTPEAMEAAAAAEKAALQEVLYVLESDDTTNLAPPQQQQQQQKGGRRASG